ncbi:hypothetical protein ACA910_000280 [Epithemia clementina (nom. ined.)]
MVWQISTLILEYKNYEVKTDVLTVYPGSLEFPEVTVCNLNEYMTSAQAQYGIGEPKSYKEFQTVAQPLDDFVTFTSFNDVQFENVSSAWIQVMTSFGLCYQLRTAAKAYVPGLAGGLNFAINLDQANYQPWQAEVGAALFTTQPGTPINGQVPFVTINPGKSAFVSIKVNRFRRERQKPWSRCKGEAPSYTNARCVDECASAVVRNTCGCKFPHDPLGEPEMRFCTSEDWSELPCSSLVGTRHSDTYAYCECDVPPCSEDRYKATVHEFDFSDSFLNDTIERANNNSSAVDFTKNYASVRLNFDNIQYQELRESKAVTLAQLIGSVGGSMGLFLGISILSVVELVGDLMLLRLIPRFCGIRKLHGLGTKTVNSP